ncbi:MAG TPA: peptidylprolyl isomerase [Caulobacteraceae bacterium]|nr:peptidylprolyl isomerase [Caulobacteraceae bacterium]
MTHLPLIAALALAIPGFHGPAPKPTKAPAISAADYRTVDPQNLLVIDTEKGRMILEMYPEIAPASVERVKTLARLKFYDGLTFHRVVPGFMAQGGDPKGDGSGGSGMPNLKPEFIFRRGGDLAYTPVIANKGLEDGFIKALPVRTQSSELMFMTADSRVSAWSLWCPGVAGMARTDDPNSADAQIFLMMGPADQLEQKYTAWGRVLIGLDVTQSLAVGEPPRRPDHMKSVRVMADLPPAEQTKVQVLDTASPAFKTLAQNAKSQHGGFFTLCDVTLPVLP